ncbi:gustatory receptor for sugar taste 64a-like, partial [Trichoplusia ni]|uniref:Gustatory receptor for sugar taste 64a-like n=1 Tax=Trichoplusia ni TaxID=7111 RepID=A0A7E5VE94_TRINI
INYTFRYFIEISFQHFLPTLNSIFSKARIFGVSAYGVNVSFLWSVILLLSLIIVESRAIFRILRVLTKYAITNLTDDGQGLTAHLAGSIFYGNALLSLFFSIRFMQSWRKLSILWLRMETTDGLNFSPDKCIRLKAIFVATSILVLASVEHMMSMMSKLDFSYPPAEMLRILILDSHGFLIGPYDYNLGIGIAIFVLSKFATALWNFQDLIIILISMGLTSRYRRLNLYVTNAIAFEKYHEGQKRFGTDLYLHIQLWRRLREAYVRQAALVRLVDKKLGGLILLSNINNLFFICLQLFNGTHRDKSSALNRGYYLFSVGFLILRACGVVLAASDVHRHSQKAVTCLNNCPSHSYNIEVKRLHYQLTHDFVALSGNGFFALRRQVLLEVAATILKYELVLIQYDK